ncbi:MAG: NUDIX hydrolase [Planctomycetes bacterium]|nr:NUDIX hydrolase [Planctomycetota bacterium]
MTGAAWQRLSKNEVFRCRYYALSHDRYLRPDGEAADYYYIDVAGATMVVPRLDDGRFVMVRQHRYLFRAPCLEFPAGGLASGVDPLENAKKELREEAGLGAGEWRRIGAFAPYNGVSNETCHLYLATALTEVGAEPEPTEQMEIVRVTPEELRAEIASGRLWDGMTAAAYGILCAQGLLSHA